jgi:hypothetical protein
MISAASATQTQIGTRFSIKRNPAMAIRPL